MNTKTRFKAASVLLIFLSVVILAAFMPFASGTADAAKKVGKPTNIKVSKVEYIKNHRDGKYKLGEVKVTWDKAKNAQAYEVSFFKSGSAFKHHMINTSAGYERAVGDFGPGTYRYGIRGFYKKWDKKRKGYKMIYGPLVKSSKFTVKKKK